MYDEIEGNDDPPEPTVIRRAASLANIYDLTKLKVAPREDLLHRRRQIATLRSWEALAIANDTLLGSHHEPDDSFIIDSLEHELLDAGQQEYTYVSLPGCSPAIFTDSIGFTKISSYSQSDTWMA